MRLDLHSLIARLENPDVRLDDNGPFRLSTEQLGIVYARFVVDANYNYSPGIVLKKNERFNPDVLEGFKKNFQSQSRNYLFKLLGALESRDFTAERLVAQYSPNKVRSDFSIHSVEGVVVRLLQEGNFEFIGQKLKEGAKEYHEMVVKKGQPLNYRMAVEYNDVLDAFKGEKK